jgi:superoxide dismutase, Cu-Zn family
MKTTQLIKIGIAVAMLLAIASVPAAAQSASATLKSASGKDVGTAQLTQTPSGVLINLSVKGLPAGEHAFHVHAVGKCEPPFTTAGGHFNPAGKKHGMLATESHHAGDMPSLHIPANAVPNFAADPTVTMRRSPFRLLTPERMLRPVFGAMR